MFRALILDWSGTLVDDMGPTLAATNAVLANYDQPSLSWEEFRGSFRLPYSEWYEERLPGVPLDELEDHFRVAFGSHQVTPLEGTAEFLAWGQSRGIRMFVLTSMDRQCFEEQLHAFGFAGYFEATYSGVVDKRTLIQEILNSHALDPGATAYVGDMVHDVETARQGGVVSVAVLSGYDLPARLSEAKPRFVLACIKSLHAMLEEHDRSREEAMTGRETISIRRLAVEAVIGVPEEERAESQTLFISVVLVPSRPFAQMGDRIEETVDYQAVADWITSCVEGRPRHLIETLANDLATGVLDRFPIAWSVEIEVEKHILPRTDAVLVRTVRVRGK